MPKNIRNANLANDQNGMVELTKKNSTAVEGLIKADKRYGLSSSQQYFNDNPDIANYDLNQFEELIRRIARDNSTRTADKDIDILAKYILSHKDKFLERLKAGDHALVDELSDLKKLGTSRKEPSLASKICRYIEEWCWGNNNYTINDSVVRAVLPYYFLYYNIDFKGNLDTMTYVEFMEWFNKLVTAVQAAEPTLSRHEIDHILWYVYRVDSIRLAIAAAIVNESKKAGRKMFLSCNCISGSTVVFPHTDRTDILY